MRKILTLTFFLLTANLSIAATSSFDCKFNLEATSSGLTKQSPLFELRFISDDEKKSAYLMGNNGSAEVKVIQNAGGISLVEVTSSGNVMVTTITKSGEAVHSRNTVMQSQLVPSQYYGKCVAK